MTQEQYNMYMNGLILKVASKKPLTKTASKFTAIKRLKDLVNFGPKKGVVKETLFPNWGDEAPKVLRDDNIVEIFTKGKDKIKGGIKGGYDKVVDTVKYLKERPAVMGPYAPSNLKLELNSLKNKGIDVLDYIKANKLGLGTAAGVGAGATASGFGIANALSDAGAAAKGFISANPYAAAGVGAAGALAAGLLGAYLLRKDEKEKANA